MNPGGFPSEWQSKLDTGKGGEVVLEGLRELEGDVSTSWGTKLDMLVLKS